MSPTPTEFFNHFRWKYPQDRFQFWASPLGEPDSARQVDMIDAEATIDGRPVMPTFWNWGIQLFSRDGNFISEIVWFDVNSSYALPLDKTAERIYQMLENNLSTLKPNEAK